MLDSWFFTLRRPLLDMCILGAVLHLPLSFVDLKPCDAHLPAVSGPAALVIVLWSGG